MVFAFGFIELGTQTVLAEEDGLNLADTNSVEADLGSSRDASKTGLFDIPFNSRSFDPILVEN